MSFLKILLKFLESFWRYEDFLLYINYVPYIFGFFDIFLLQIN